MKYLKLLKLGVKKVFIYRSSIILILFSSVASIFILQKFWFALYGNDHEQYLYMANYAIVSKILAIVYSIKSPNMLTQRIRSGAISVELLRPWEYINALLFEDLGTIIGNLLSSGVVLFITAKVLFNMVVPPIINIMLFLISAILGFLLLFLIKILVAMICFWIMEASTFLVLINVVINLLSGSFLPTWIMPSWLENIMNALPFIWIYQKPISVYLGATGGSIVEELSGYGKIFALQLGWGVALYLVVLWVWRVAVNKLSVQGG